MGLHEVPRRVDRRPVLIEPILQAAIRLVSRDHQVLLYRCCGGHLAIAALNLVERSDLGHHEASLLQRDLDRIPDRRLAV